MYMYAYTHYKHTNIHTTHIYSFNPPRSPSVLYSPEGTLIGRFRFDRPVSNVAFGGDGRLYFTAKDVIARVNNRHITIIDTSQ
jgi:sugar lactone lactonase YvrE